jgi:plastocyanin
MPMKGARALLGAVVVLAVACAIPAISAAQGTGTTVPEDPAISGSGLDAASGRISEAPAASSPAGAATAASAPTAQKAASASVTIVDFSFSPGSVSVAVGDTVTWSNTGQAPHTATADDGSFDTGTVNPGGSASHRFTQPGTFSYVCTIHPNMHGTVRVLAASSGGGGGSGSSGAGSSGSSSSGADQSEASAVASPNAAGDSNTLPMTGMAVGGLAVVGLALLGSGLLARATGRRWMTPF